MEMTMTGHRCLLGMLSHQRRLRIGMIRTDHHCRPGMVPRYRLDILSNRRN